jgi:hypothetical protein
MPSTKETKFTPQIHQITQIVYVYLVQNDRSSHYFEPGIWKMGTSFWKEDPKKVSRLTLTDNNQNQQLKLILTTQRKEKHTKPYHRLFVKIPVIKTYNPRL